MPEGIVTRLINPVDGCPARAGQLGSIFEMFRVGNVPECETSEAPPDIFNDTRGIDDLFGGGEEETEAGADEETADGEIPAADDEAADDDEPEDDLF